MDALAMPWANARAAHLLAIRRMAPVKVGNDCEEGYNTNQDGFVMHTQKVETIRTFFFPCDTHEDNGSTLGRTS